MAVLRRRQLRDAGKFDAAAALAAIAAHRVTHSQWVPTMFIRLLRLPDAERARHDLSSLLRGARGRAVPGRVKQAMIRWWGRSCTSTTAAPSWSGAPRRLRGMAGASRLGGPARVRRCISSARTASGNCRRGSRASSISRRRRLEYQDPAKTRKAYNARGWATYGDIGYLDADGYLYLTDRLSNMIVSGGVNIYPQEAENLLCTHPAVADVAVIGVPDAEFGEAVKAVVQLRDRRTRARRWRRR